MKRLRLITLLLVVLLTCPASPSRQSNERANQQQTRANSRVYKTQLANPEAIKSGSGQSSPRSKDESGRQRSMARIYLQP